MGRFFALILLVILFLATPRFVHAVLAATLKFDQTSVSVASGGTFNINVIIDAGSDQVTSTDAYVTFDSSLLTAQSVAAGSYFPTVSNNISAGRVYVAGIVASAGASETGSGTLATITFKANTAGTATLAFDCQAGLSSTSKVIKNDINATNVLDCTQTGTSTVTVGSGGTPGGGSSNTGTSTNLTPTPSALPKTGFFDEAKYIIPGGMLILLGIMARLALL